MFCDILFEIVIVRLNFFENSTAKSIKTSAKVHKNIRFRNKPFLY